MYMGPTPMSIKTWKEHPQVFNHAIMFINIYFNVYKNIMMYQCYIIDLEKEYLVATQSRLFLLALLWTIKNIL